MKTPLRLCLAILLLALLLACGFAFAATFEPPGFPLLRVVYGLLAGVLVAILVIVARPPRRV